MKKIAFDFSKNDIFIDTDKKLNKKERDFLEIIKERHKEKNEKYIVFTDKELRNIIKDKESIEEFLDKFLKRRIHLKLIEKEEEIFFSSFPIFDFYIKSNGEYKLYISGALTSLKESGIFDDIDLLLILLFKDKKSFQLYLTMIKNRNQKKFTISKEQLKEILGVGQENYERFYDFEKTILKPALDDINQLTKYDIEYKKIKNSDGFTSKIVEVEFIFSHKLSPLLETETINIEQEKYTLVNKVVGIFSNRFIFESKLYKELLKNKFYYNYEFLKALRKMKLGNPLEYKDETYKINVLYSEKGKESMIEIYKKN